MPILQINKLFKKYSRNNNLALDNVTFKIERGDHLALIGKNGSGKTTLIKAITQLTYPTNGEIFFEDEKIDRFNKKNIGLMLGNSLLYHRLTVKQNLEYYASLYDVTNIKKTIFDILKHLNILDKLNSLVEDLSEGQKSKVAFARAVIHKPKLLILDEPTTGLDPLSAELIMKEIRNYPTVIFSTHNLSEVIDTANKVLVLANGKNVFFGPTASLGETPQKITIKLRGLL